MKIATEVLNLVGSLAWLGLAAWLILRFYEIRKWEKDLDRRRREQVDFMDRQLGINTRRPPRETPPS